MTEPVIETRGLTRRFGDILAVDQLDLHILPGEVFGFLGPNGAGKTTTVRLVNGVLNPTEGEVRVLGLDPFRDGPAVRRHTGVLTESPAIYEPLSARENLRIFGALYDVPDDQLEGRITALLEVFGLEARADDKVAGYSKGMKQRLALARALIHAPDILFLDEPTAGLDPIAAKQVSDVIERLSEEEGRTIFLCTHNLVEAQRLCDRVGVIDKGRLIALGTPAELAEKLWHGLWVEIELAGLSPADALSTLRGVPGVVDSRWEERLLHVHVNNRAHTPVLVRALVEAGGDIFRVAPREHTLEDIYFALQNMSNGESA